MNGRLDLQNASFNYASAPNGISNANGSVFFNGNTATLQNITGESGGGKVRLTGFVTMGDTCASECGGTSMLCGFGPSRA